MPHEPPEIASSALARVRSALSSRDRRQRVVLPTALLLVAILIAVAVPASFSARRRHALELVPQVQGLAEERRFVEAFVLLASAERWLRGDSAVARLARKVSDSLTIRTQPYGARVFLQRFSPDADESFPDSTYVGTTPLYGLRIPRVDHRVVIFRQGYAPIERVVSSADQRILSVVDEADPIELSVRLVPADSVPADAVFVPGDGYELVSPDVPSGFRAWLADYLIDRFEVTNEAYASFVHAGGYAARKYWRVPFAEGGREVSWEQGMRRLVDRTGRPGPREWVGQEPPQGEERHPVRAVTWYEAAAYCAFRGKDLPTVFEWEKAARDGRTTHGHGIIMPWGLAGPSESTKYRANFGGVTTVPVDANPFGISPYGAYAMAGNVKEWMRNRSGSGYIATGGSWQDPMYAFSEYGTFTPWLAAPTLGFRCATRASPPTDDQGGGPIALDQRTPTYMPVDPVDSAGHAPPARGPRVRDQRVDR